MIGERVGDIEGNRTGGIGRDLPSYPPLPGPSNCSTLSGFSLPKTTEGFVFIHPSPIQHDKTPTFESDFPIPVHKDTGQMDGTE